MEKTEWHLVTPNGVILCVDHTTDRQISGRSYHAYSRESEKFQNLDEAVFLLEQLYDWLDFPHRTTDCRSFFGECPERKSLGKGLGQRRTAGKRKEYAAQGISGTQERAKIMADNELLGRHGDMGTFIIRVQHRQNSSWQGCITWMEKNKTVCFRSIWEMVKLVTGALDSVSKSEEEESRQEEPSWE